MIFEQGACIVMVLGEVGCRKGRSQHALLEPLIHPASLEGVMSRAIGRLHNS